jgi:ATP-binding cassette, subfamily B (MDR/TAP), member 1
VSRGNFWALMYFVISLVTLVSYFLLGCAATAAAVVSVPLTVRSGSTLIDQAVSADSMTEYFENLVWKPIPYFDEEGTSPGTLTAQTSNGRTTRVRQLAC